MKQETYEIESGRKLYMYSFDNQSAERQRRFWNSVGGAWRKEQDTIEEWTEPVTGAINDRIGNYPCRALDLGCGPRPMPLGDKWRVFGVDPAAEMMTGNRSIQADSHSLPFQDASFDAVVSRFALMLDDDPLLAFREAHRILRLGGTITLAVWEAPEKNTWVSAAESVLTDALGIRKPSPTEPSAYRLADPAEVKALLSAAGFRITHTDSIHLPYFAQRTAEETFEFLVRFIGPIRTMFEKIPPENRDALHAKAVAVLAEVSRNGTAWVYHAIREPKNL